LTQPSQAGIMHTSKHKHSSTGCTTQEHYSMSATRELACKCKHEYQDANYGKGMRVHNRTANTTSKSKDAGANWVYRCTVCNATNTASGEAL